MNSATYYPNGYPPPPNYSFPPPPQHNPGFSVQQKPVQCLSQRECEDKIKPYKTWVGILAALAIVFFVLAIIFVIIASKKKKQ